MSILRKQRMPSPTTHTEPPRRNMRPSIVAISLFFASLPASLCLPEKICGQTHVDPRSGALVQQNSPAETEMRSTKELQAGTSLTRNGELQEAIPHLLSARAAGADSYAAGVNLAICYFGTGDYKQAISELENLRSIGKGTTVVFNLLAQASLADGQPQAAWNSFLAAVALAPDDEKVYAYFADACTDAHNIEMGLRAMSFGLSHLPDSARLHYERGLFLAQLDRLDEARPEWDRAAQLAPDTYIGTQALVQRDLYDGKFKQAIERVLAAISAGNRDYQTLSLLGLVLLRSGALPGDPGFAQAQAVLEESAHTNPEYSPTQIALGRIYVLEERYREAVEHLEIGRRLEPRNPTVYSNLARAYQSLGDLAKAHEMREQFARLLAHNGASRESSGSTSP